MDSQLQKTFGEQGPVEKLRKVMEDVGAKLREQLLQPPTKPSVEVRKNDLLDAAMAESRQPAPALPTGDSRKNDLLDTAMGVQVKQQANDFAMVLVGAFHGALSKVRGGGLGPTVTQSGPPQLGYSGGPLGAFRGGYLPTPEPQGNDCCDIIAGHLVKIQGQIAGISMRMGLGGYGGPPVPQPEPEPEEKTKPPMGMWERFKRSMRDNLGLGGFVKAWDDPRGLAQSGAQDRKDAGMIKKAGLPGGTALDLLGRGKEAGGKFMAAAQDRSDLGGLGKMMGGAGSLVGAIPYVGKPLEAMLKFGEVAFKAVDRLQKWTDQLHQANMQFAEFSGAMAGVAARQEWRDIQLSKERGDRRAGTAEELAQSKSNLARETAKIGDFMGNIWNKAGSVLSDVVSKIIKPAADLIEKIDEKLFGGKGKAENPGLGRGTEDWMKRETEAYQQHGRPNRFGGGGRP